MCNTCNCCQGVEAITPMTIDNRPGLSALDYRVGIHATFFETMQARLSAGKNNPLTGLTTRSLDDPSIALLDAWAVVGDVLTFYQERIANEGYLRTATERRSILELARLVGYKLRPGVASSVFLSYTIEDGKTTIIPAGSRAQSIPGPGQTPQSFETSAPIEARAAWNAIPPKTHVAQYISQLMLPVTNTTPPSVKRSTNSLFISTADGALYLAGTSTNLKPHDPLLFVFSEQQDQQVFGHLQSVDVNFAKQYTRVVLPPEFTPSQFFQGLRDLWSLYQDVEAFGLVRGDPFVAAITNVLRKLTTILTEAEPFDLDGFRISGPKNALLIQRITSLTLLTTAMKAFCAIYTAVIGGRPQDFVLTHDLPAILLPGLDVFLPSPGDISFEPSTKTNSLIGQGHSSRAALASWLSGIINDTRAIVSSIPEFRSIETVQAICQPPVTTSLASLVFPLAQLPSQPPVNSTRLQRDLKQLFARKSDIAPQLLSALNPLVGQNIYAALANANVTLAPPLDSLYMFKVKAAPFGNNAPQQITTNTVTTPPGGHDTTTKSTTTITPNEWPLAQTDIDGEDKGFLYLDAQYDQIVPDSWVVITYVQPSSDADSGVEDMTIPALAVYKVLQVDSVTRTDYGLSVKVTRLTLDRPWFEENPGDIKEMKLAAFRGVTVYVQSQQLELADEPVSDDVSGSVVELDDLYDGLQSGRWAVVSGERSDIANTSGIRTSELLMIASVEQSVRTVTPPPVPDLSTLSGSNPPPAEQPATGNDEQPAPSSPPASGTTDTASATSATNANKPIPLPGDKTHTFLHFAKSLSYTYKRDTVTVAANVVRATQGETRIEVIGSGDGSKSTQQFTLSQSPLTYTSAPTVTGIESTLEVRVNGILWHETDTLAAASSTDRLYQTKTDDTDKVSVTFGNGQHGARLSSGAENVSATYRTGIGTSGNVDAEQISLLASRPLSVQGVINPAAATGGADREGGDSARRNIPLGVTSLDRLVSVQDYADFARTFAGIGKTSATLLTAGRRRIVHLTIAGSENIPINRTSDLFRNLVQALRQFGNPSEPLQVALCEVKLLVISARIRVLPDFKLELVAPTIRAALLAAFSFDQRDLGQSVYESEVLSVIQNVPGVAYVDLDILDAIDQQKLIDALDKIHLEELQQVPSNLTEDLTKLLNLRVRPVVPVQLATQGTTRRSHASSSASSTIAPAQLAFLSPDVPDTLILRELV